MWTVFEKNDALLNVFQLPIAIHFELVKVMLMQAGFEQLHKVHF